MSRSRPIVQIPSNQPWIVPDRPDRLSKMTSNLNPPATKRRTRSSSAMELDESVDSEMREERQSVSRASTSSIQDSAANSGYSTPATSAVATPAPFQKPKAPVSAMQRARSLRNSKYSLNPTNSKRKRGSPDDEDEDEDEDDDEDNTADAQLARALQEQENSKLNQMTAASDFDELTPSGRFKRLRAIRPKADYALGSSDESDFQSIAKIPTPKRSKTVVPDSNSDDDSDFSMTNDDDDDDDDDDDVALAAKAAARVASDPAPAAESDSDAPIRNRLAFRARAVRGRPAVRARPSARRRPIPTRNAPPPPSREQIAAHNCANIPDSQDDSELTHLSSDSEDYLMDDNNLHRLDPGQRLRRRARLDRDRLEMHHPELLTMWEDLKNLPQIEKVKAEQPKNISRELKPFQLEGLSWMKAMEQTEWGGGLLGDEMGMGKTIQAVSLIMSDYPAKSPSLVLIPPVALMQWQQEIGDYTDGTLKTFVFHGTNAKSKNITVKDLKKYDVILMSYNSLESLYRFQEKGRKRKGEDGMETVFQKSVIHQIQFHRVILDEAHNIKQRTTGVAKACFALKADHKWCLSGTPLQNRIGEFFSLIRFLDVRPFACYFCKGCPCSKLEWAMNDDNRCTECGHSGMQHVSVFNQELLNPIQKYGNKGLGKAAFEKLRLLTSRFMLRRVKRDHSAAMELPAKEIYVDRKFFSEEENDFAGSIMNNNNRKFETYVAQGVLLNNYANIFGLIMQMRQVADHPDLILKKNSEGGQNVLVCSICDETAEDAIRSTCHHDFCRSCVKGYIKSQEELDLDPTCQRCHLPLAIDLEQPELEQDEALVKKNSIINRIKMENWTSSSKIELLVYELHLLRSKNSSSKSIIFSGFTTMLQLVEWRLRRAGITTVMLDGSMTPAQRQASINAFMTDPKIECFLVSLKAGGVALNLTEASKVFIVDPWWNPAAEWQSADRCHRIGQCRPCSITRLCIEDSVESRMVLLQEKKSNMINSTINKDEAAMESLTPEDMQFLFRGT